MTQGGVAESRSGAPVDITPELVKRLRDLTGAGMMDCKRALEESGGDIELAVDVLRKKGKADLKRRASRSANEGRIESYVHMGRLGVLIEVNSETDFVANTDEFKNLARELAMQVAATETRWISPEEVPEEEIERERKIYEELARQDEKPEHIIPKIVEGKLEAFYRSHVLLRQPWIRDDTRTVEELVSEVSAKVGEKVHVRRFAKFRLGDELI
jgi:elongation factor Ts